MIQNCQARLHEMPNKIQMGNQKGKLSSYWLCQKNNASHNFKLSSKSTRAAQSQRYQSYPKGYGKISKYKMLLIKYAGKQEYAE